MCIKDRILDEPSVGLDPTQVVEMRALIREVAQDTTVILSSHILSEVQAVCGRVLVLNRGRLIADDTPGHLAEIMHGKRRVAVRVLGEEQAVRAALELSLIHIWLSRFFWRWQGCGTGARQHARGYL